MTWDGLPRVQKDQEAKTLARVVSQCMFVDLPYRIDRRGWSA